MFPPSKVGEPRRVPGSQDLGKEREFQTGAREICLCL